MRNGSESVWSLFPGTILIFVGFGAESAQGLIKSYELAWGVYYVASAFNILTPIVLTYVALNRRLLDIGFVLNRAAVFALVSTMLIAAFVIVEWIANEWWSANHTTSAIAGMLVALALGLSMRYIHTFADRFVDRVLFRKRYEDEAALRRFAHEAGFITNRITLLERAVSTVKLPPEPTRRSSCLTTVDRASTKTIRRSSHSALGTSRWTLSRSRARRCEDNLRFRWSREAN